MLEIRQKESAEAWAAYEDLGHKREANDANVVIVGGRKVRVTWDSLILDQQPSRKRELKQVLDEKTGGLKEVMVEAEEDEDAMHWRGHTLVRPRYTPWMPLEFTGTNRS